MFCDQVQGQGLGEPTKNEKTGALGLEGWGRSCEEWSTQVIRRCSFLKAQTQRSKLWADQ